MLAKMNLAISITYRNKKDERWVIYSKRGERQQKITADWFHWMHHTVDKNS